MVAAAVLGGSAISGISGLIGSSTSASAQQQASQNQLAATQAAIAAEQGMFQTGLGYTSPYATSGTAAEDEILGEMGLAGAYGGTNTGGNFSGTGGYLGSMPSLTDPTQLPGYSFTLDQGLKATQNAATSQGLGVSGAAMKGAVNYAEGLASTFYNNYLSNYWTNQNNRFNMLADLANKGLGAATSIQGNAVTTGGQVGTTGVSGTAAANNNAIGAANTTAAGISGLGSNIGSSLLLANALSGNAGTTISGAGNANATDATYSGGGDASAGYTPIG